MQVELFLL